MPFICAEGQEGDRPASFRDPDSADYRTAPQSHPKYLWLMEFVLMPLIGLVAASLRLKELLLLAPELAGLRYCASAAHVLITVLYICTSVCTS